VRASRLRRVAYIPQGAMNSLNPVLRLREQILDGLADHGAHPDRKAADALVVGALEGVGLSPALARAYPHQLSGGMKQRVMIAMALAAHPALLVADEPTTALDVTIQAQILELLRRLQRDLGMAILLISHDFGIVNALADRVAVMYAGQLVEEGTRHDLLASARHPYTVGLLQAMPGRVRRGARLAEIPGVVPSLGERPTGCRFATRCPLVFEPCRSIDPAWTRVADSQAARCHAVAEGKA
jgi:oligopeptide/dipeptide ABC transporter ATP-binding protein